METPFWQKVILVLISVLFTLLVLEISLRILLKEKSRAYIYQSEETLGILYAPNLDTEIPAENESGLVRLQTNTHGFIMPDWSPNNPDRYRIAHIGDSFTAGEAVPFEENYVSEIGRDMSVESLNFGIPGQGTYDALNTYTLYASSSHPDMLVLWFYLGNDLNDNYKDFIQSPDANLDLAALQESTATKQFELKVLSESKKLLIRSGLAHIAFVTLSKIPSIGEFVSRLGFKNTEVPEEIKLTYTEALSEKTNTALSATEAWLTELKKLTHEKGIPFAVILVPNQFQVETSSEDRLHAQFPKLKELGFDHLLPNNTVGSILDRLSIPYLDLSTAFTPICEQEEDNCSLYVCRFCHLSTRGHKEAARTVAPFLESVKLEFGRTQSSSTKP